MQTHWDIFCIVHGFLLVFTPFEGLNMRRNNKLVCPYWTLFKSQVHPHLERKPPVNIIQCNIYINITKIWFQLKAGQFKACKPIELMFVLSFLLVVHSFQGAVKLAETTSVSFHTGIMLKQQLLWLEHEQQRFAACHIEWFRTTLLRQINRATCWRYQTSTSQCAAALPPPPEKGGGCPISAYCMKLQHHILPWDVGQLFRGQCILSLV